MGILCIGRNYALVLVPPRQVMPLQISIGLCQRFHLGVTHIFHQAILRRAEETVLSSILCKRFFLKAVLTAGIVDPFPTAELVHPPSVLLCFR